MSTTEVTISSLGDAIRDKVRAVIFGAIPDSVVENLIKQELLKMQETRYHGQASELSALITAEIKTQLSVRVKASVADYLDKNLAVDAKGTTEEFVKQLAPIAMEGFAASMAFNVANQLRNEIRSGNLRGNY